MPTRFDLLYYLLTPVAGPYLLWRRYSKGKYRQSGPGMFGRNLPTGPARQKFRNGSIWIHAVSVGETVAAKSIAPHIRALYPDLPLVITTITETGQAHARKLLTEADEIHYFPLDFSWNVQRFFDCFNPHLFIMMETELWPNFLTECGRRDIDVFMVNGKISENSFKGYRKGKGLLAPAFRAIHAFCMQTEADAERMRHLCDRPADVHVTGNCKFDAPMEALTPEAANVLRERYRLGPANRPRLVVGSTHPGEEDVILEAFAQLKNNLPDLQMILSPRHPERFAEVTEQCRRRPAKWSVSTATKRETDNPDIFILDTMGELAQTYGIADVAVVAGSFSPQVGGHNILEAAAHAVPVIVGPHMHSQKELDRLFREPESGLVRVESDSLAQALSDLFRNPEKRKTLGQQARHTALCNQGSAQNSVKIIQRYLGN